MKVRGAAASHPGRVRENNEDRFHCDVERGIYVVVDGVGGRAGGEMAAETALLQVRTRLERTAGATDARLREAITLANNEVFRLSRTNAAWEGMACVLTAAVVEDRTITIGHVGDSRLYKLRDGSLTKLTHDHSPVGEREDAGELHEAAAMRHPRRNEVFRDIGSEPHTPADSDFVEIISGTFEDDAALLLCSDGLSDLVTSGQMLAISRDSAGNPDLVVRRLIAAANDAGGKDNVTVVYVEGPEYAASREGDAMASGRGQARTRRAVTHIGALIGGAVLGALAVTVTPSWLAALLPATPVTAEAEPPAAPRTLRVQQSGAADFATITDALANALPGDTVVVGPGEYREQLTLPPGVTLASEVTHRAIIRAPASAEPRPAITVDGAGESRLHGFQVVADAAEMPVGVLVLAGDVELEDMRVSGATDAAIDVWSKTTVTLRANDLTDNPGVGVRIRRGAQPTLLHNRILRNGRSGTRAAGVLLDIGAAPLLVVGNVIADNGGHGIAGVGAEAGAAFLRNNVFVADAKANARGALGLLGPATPARR